MLKSCRWCILSSIRDLFFFMLIKMTEMDNGFDPAYTKLKAVKEEADSLGLPESITKGLQSAIDLYQKRERFCVKMTTEPSEAVQGIVEYTLNHPWKQDFNEGKTKCNVNAKMLSGHLEGCFLKFLISSSRAKRVLEIGMFTGCGTLGMAEVLPENGKVFACEFDPYLIKFARGLVDKSPHGKKIEIIEGAALDSMRDLAKKGEKFDFVFVDAVKKEYIDYVKICLDDLLACGGTIAVDNALHFGTPYAGKPDEPLSMFNEWILTRHDICHVMLPVRDGILLIRRKEDMEAVNDK